MGLFYSKPEMMKPDENRKQIVDLPPEMIEKIFSYIPKKEMRKVSFVQKQWMAIINSKIENILIRRPNQDNLPQVRNLINRFPKLAILEINVESASEVNHCLDCLPLNSLAFHGIQLEFAINRSWKSPLPSDIYDVFLMCVFSETSMTWLMEMV